jgi:hypothetical protein
MGDGTAREESEIMVYIYTEWSGERKELVNLMGRMMDF